MSALKESVMTICFSFVAVGVIEMLLPSGSFKPQMKLITGVILMISILSPFIGKTDINFDQFNFDSVDFSTSASFEKGVAASLKESVAEIIVQNDISKAKIKIIMDTGTDDSIIIKETQIYLQETDMDRADKLCDQIESQLGIVVVIGELE